METKKIALVIPAYNESAHLQTTVVSILDWMPPAGSILSELVIVDDGSGDETGKIAQELAGRDARIRVLTHPVNRGKGISVRDGMSSCRSDIVGFTDGDFAYSPDNFDQLLLPILNGHSDVTVGNRRIGKGYAGYSWRRRIASELFRITVNLLGLTGVSDSQCGLKFFRKPALERLLPLLQCGNFAFDVELLHLCKLLKLTVSEHPVSMNVQSSSSIFIKKQVWTIAQSLLKIRVTHYPISGD